MEKININIYYGLKHNSVEAKAFEDKIKIIEEKNTMSNKSLVPEAKEALNKFKMEAASDVGVNLKQGYNGDLTSRQAGKAGRFYRRTDGQHHDTRTNKSVQQKKQNRQRAYAVYYI